MFAELSPVANFGLLAVLVAAGSAGGIYLANAASRRDAAPPTLRSTAMNKLKAIICLIYVLSPIDLVPEAALGPFGLADDVVVGLVGMRAWFRKGGD